MNKMMMFVMICLLSASQTVFAKSMSCLIGVIKVADLVSENQSDLEQNSMKVTEVQIVGNKGELQTVINGESVEVSFYKRSFADVYDMSVVLLTPAADRHPGTGFVSVLEEYLINEGPAKDNGFQPNVRPGAFTFEYMNRPSGTLLVTLKARRAMEAAGLWGQHPFTTTYMNVQYASDYADAVKVLVAKGLLKKADVAALGTAFSCTLNK